MSEWVKFIHSFRTHMVVGWGGPPHVLLGVMRGGGRGERGWSGGGGEGRVGGGIRTPAVLVLAARRGSRGPTDRGPRSRARAPVL